MEEENRIIASIKQRILNEYKKHGSLDWAEIAARKIYRTHLVKTCNKPAVSCSLPLPEFLYDNGLGCILSGVHGDSNVTDEWNEWLKNNVANDR